MDSGSKVWIQEKLSNLYNFSNGINTLKENYGHGRKMISVMDILSKDYLLYENVINYVNVGLPEEESFKVEANDLVFVRSSETKDEVGWAKTYRDTNYSLYSGFVIRGKVYGDVNSFFVENTLNYKQRRQIQALANGSTRYNISQQTLNSIKIALPQFEEQNRISTLLEKIDSIITLEQEKLAHYKQIKMMLLSKLFATKENSVPEMRFKEFSEKWAQHELSEISSITMGQSPSSNNYTNNPNDYILVQGNADLENGKVIPRIWTTEVTKSVNKGAIILTVRAPVGDVAISHYEVVLGRGVAALTGNYFIYYLLIRMNVTNYWRKYSTGSTFESINSSDIQRALIEVPSLDEQEKIGYTLNKIDKIITLEQTRIEHYQSIKNNLLHNLFI